MNILVIDQDNDFCVEIASMLCVHDVLGATTLKATEEIIKKENSPDREVFMKSVILRIIGILIILFSLLCPFSPVFGIPGLGWRAIIGGMLLSCFQIKKDICWKEYA